MKNDFGYVFGPVPSRRLGRLFSGETEIIAEYQPPREPAGETSRAEDVLALLGRRPCTVKDVADGLALHPTQAAKMLEHLHDAGQITEHRIAGCVYHKLKNPNQEEERN